jgi:prepilin-type processing-associated H-X9-DG protein
MDEGDLAPQVLRSPLDDSDDEASYIYIPGQTTGGNSQNILAYEKLENNDWEGTNVLFIDAHVDWMSAEDFEEALEATQQRLRSGSEEAELKP